MHFVDIIKNLESNGNFWLIYLLVLLFDTNIAGKDVWLIINKFSTVVYTEGWKGKTS